MSIGQHTVHSGVMSAILFQNLTVSSDVYLVLMVVAAFYHCACSTCFALDTESRVTNDLARLGGGCWFVIPSL